MLTRLHDGSYLPKAKLLVFSQPLPVPHLLPVCTVDQSNQFEILGFTDQNVVSFAKIVLKENTALQVFSYVSCWQCCSSWSIVSAFAVCCGCQYLTWLLFRAMHGSKTHNRNSFNYLQGTPSSPYAVQGVLKLQNDTKINR